MSYTQTLVCNASDTGWMRYPHSTRAPRAQGRADDDDIHPCTESRREGRQEPGGQVVKEVPCVMGGNGIRPLRPQRSFVEEAHL